MPSPSHRSRLLLPGCRAPPVPTWPVLLEPWDRGPISDFVSQSRGSPERLCLWWTLYSQPGPRLGWTDKKCGLRREGGALGPMAAWVLTQVTLPPPMALQAQEGPSPLPASLSWGHPRGPAGCLLLPRCPGQHPRHGQSCQSLAQVQRSPGGWGGARWLQPSPLLSPTYRVVTGTWHPLRGAHSPA